MSKKNEINNNFLEDLSDLISTNSSQKIKELICDLHIADIAEIISEISIDKANPH